ncbi:MAG: hypothetical protein VW907_09975, partial [Opitutae bacterium]
LRQQKIQKIIVPKRTYISVHFLKNKLKIKLEWKDENWKDYYYIGSPLCMLVATPPVSGL